MRTGTDAWIYEQPVSLISRRARRKMIRKHRKQRIEQGFSTYDAWNGDRYLLGVIAGMAEWLRTEGVGYPGHMTEEAWAETLDSISQPLRSYLNGNFWPSEAEITATTAALHLFADNFGYFWD